MLFGALILITTILTTNGLPTAPSIGSGQIALQNSAQQQVVYQVPNQQDFLYQSFEQTPNYQPSGEDYIAYDDSKPTFTEQNAGFTISCEGSNKICAYKHDCINGFVHIANNGAYAASKKSQECNINVEVCCTIAEQFRGTSANADKPEQELSSGANNIGINVGRPFESASQSPESIGTVNLGTSEVTDQNVFTPPLQIGCAAALLCVEEKFCTADGTISPEPVPLESIQLFQRVPLSSCKNPDNGIIGKCCRDPNYVDPWPTGNLPANYSGGFDEQGFPTFLNIAKQRPNKAPTKAPTPFRPQKLPEQKAEPALVPENSVVSSEVLVPPVENVPQDENPSIEYQANQPTQVCGVRNKGSQTRPKDSQTTFAEIPWQAMVLHASDRKILCSGALVDALHVVTAASCIDSLSPSDISIKLGEWKLGYELQHEEPLPYKIFNVSYVDKHEGYSGPGEQDLAMLQLNSPATFDYHINPLCLPNVKQSLPSNRPCITTGWGKSILQANYAGAIMHAVGVNILSTDRCKEQVANSDLSLNNVDGTICAATKEERNNVCETDVGGPLACQNENGLYELAGIYSQDTGCHATNQVAIFAPLDNEWIQEMMSKRTTQSNIEYADSRESTLSTDNQYLPPN